MQCILKNKYENCMYPKIDYLLLYKFNLEKLLLFTSPINNQYLLSKNEVKLS